MTGGYSVVPASDLAENEVHSGFVSRLTAEYVALSLNEGRAEPGHYLWYTRIERESRWCVVRRGDG